MNSVARIEKKFLVADVSRHELMSHILSNPAGFEEIFCQRTVNNVYFDNLEASSYWDNVDGLSERVKVRLRWYGKTFSVEIEPSVLEFKLKHGYACEKFSLAFNKPLAFEGSKFDISKENLMKEIQEVARSHPELYPHTINIDPVLINTYKRRYFLSLDRKFRLTIDWDLAYFPYASKLAPSLRRIPGNDLCIVELKYDENDDINAPNITTNFPFRYTRSSKYVSGIDSIHAGKSQVF